MNLTQSFEVVWPKLNSLSSQTQEGNAVLEKVLAMIILGLGSFIAGILPAFIPERNSRFPLATSLMMCFGAGVLLATALIHILPEIRKQINSNWAEITLCVGFFAIYLIDEMIHYFFGEAFQDSQAHDTIETGPSNSSANGHRHNYGSLGSSESAPLLNVQGLDTTNGEAQSHIDHIEHHEPIHCNEEIVIDVRPTVYDTSNITGTLGLSVALSLHSIIEGLAIGVQDSSTKVLFLLGAVGCHKFVMSFCLGLIFRSNPQTPLKSQIICISVFALGAISGIGLGMIIIDVPSTWSTTALPVIQGLAGGTLLYVTVCEVIPRERAKSHLNSEQHLAGFAQFLIVAIGFTTMCAINFYFDE